MNHQEKISAFRAAFPHTLPIFAGFLFLGGAYGIYMNSLGFHPIYPILMSLFIFAGSMEFVAGGLLLATFNPVSALVLTLMVNARHLFYGLSLLEKYSGVGRKKGYLIYGLCDESFSISQATDVPKGIDKGWFFFFITLLNHCYWVLGSALGSIFGSFITFSTEGIEFVMTALFVVIFMEQWKKGKQYHSALIGIGFSSVSLFVFGPNSFIIPAMILILAVLTLIRKPVQKAEVTM
ncbi:AzlC family ABC transporter permease [Priestia flexa]